MLVFSKILVAHLWISFSSLVTASLMTISLHLKEDWCPPSFCPSSWYLRSHQFPEVALAGKLSCHGRLWLLCSPMWTTQYWCKLIEPLLTCWCARLHFQQRIYNIDLQTGFQTVNVSVEYMSLTPAAVYCVRWLEVFSLWYQVSHCWKHGHKILGYNRVSFSLFIIFISIRSVAVQISVD